MKKTALILLFSALHVHSIFAQIKVQDTLLLAYSENIFWGASSELEKDIYADYGKYGSTNLADNDPTTCWAEGSENDGSGEYLWLSVPKNTETIQIRNGYQKSQEIYEANNRPKHVKIELYAGYEPAGYVTESHNGFFISRALDSASVKLEDRLGYQDILLNFEWPSINQLLNNNDLFDEDRFLLKLEIIDVYTGDQWNDACISDISYVANPYYEITLDDHGLLKVSENKTDTLFYDPEKVYQVVEVSADLEWIIFIIMPSDIENTRVETIYKLYNSPKEDFVEIKDAYEMYGFETKNGKLYLSGSDKDFNDISVSLDDLN